MTLSDFLDQFNVPYKRHGEHRHATSPFIQVDCPFCSPDSDHFRLGIAVNLRTANCWTCGPHSVYESLIELTGESFAVIKSLLADIDLADAPKARTRGKLVLPKGLGPLQDAHKAYLHERNLSPNRLQRLYGVQGIGIAPRLQWRLFIPIRINGRTVSWTTRSLLSSGARYINAKPTEEEVPAKSLLYGAELARHAIVVTEGPFNVFRIGPGSVATMGVNVSQAQLLAISKYPIRCICFDSEPLAQKRARNLCDALEVLPGKTCIAELQTGKDPAEAKQREIDQLRKHFLGE